MSATGRARSPLEWASLTRPDGVVIQQARARNNSWYLVVPASDGSYELRYASQSANTHVLSTRDIDEAKRAAETHADRYDTRA
ncbi:MAG TPA: hypothetical protein VFC31_10785 [Candidatus Limnocylindria bacterium]|nr:hypothetical protein [Candidatus Limnocylindria bacterium]